MEIFRHLIEILIAGFLLIGLWTNFAGAAEPPILINECSKVEQIIKPFIGV